MTDNSRLLFLCEKFIKKEYSLVEFLSRLETANFPDHLNDFQDKIINQLAYIQFTEEEKDYYRKTLGIIEKLKTELK